MTKIVHNFKKNKEEIPLFENKIDGRSGWYKLGKDNKYYDYLNKLYKRSSNHAAMIDNISQRIIGTGFQSDDPIEQEKIKAYEINEWFYDVAKNYTLYGGYSTEIIWNTLHSFINNFYSSKLDRIRIGLMDEDTEEPTLYYYSPNFSDFTYAGANKNIDILYKFDPSKYTDEHQIDYFFGNNRVGDDVYPRPNYNAAIPWIIVDYELPNYYMNLVLNSFMVSNILIVPEIPDENDKVAFEEGLKDDFTGTDNPASTLIIYTSQEGENKVQLLNVAGDQGERKYDELINIAVESISRSHGYPSPMLAGLSLPGNLFGISDLPYLETMLNKQLIYPMRQDILKTFNKINKYLKYPLVNFYIKDINVFDEKTT